MWYQTTIWITIQCETKSAPDVATHAEYGAEPVAEFPPDAEPPELVPGSAFAPDAVHVESVGGLAPAAEPAALTATAYSDDEARDTRFEQVKKLFNQCNGYKKISGEALAVGPRFTSEVSPRLTFASEQITWAC